MTWPLQKYSHPFFLKNKKCMKAAQTNINIQCNISKHLISCFFVNKVFSSVSLSTVSIVFVEIIWDPNYIIYWMQMGVLYAWYWKWVGVLNWQYFSLNFLMVPSLPKSAYLYISAKYVTSFSHTCTIKHNCSEEECWLTCVGAITHVTDLYLNYAVLIHDFQSQKQNLCLSPSDSVPLKPGHIWLKQWCSEDNWIHSKLIC